MPFTFGEKHKKKIYKIKTQRLTGNFHILTVRYNSTITMKIDNKLNVLPLTKSKPGTLKSLFGKTNIEPFWVADMEFEIAKPIQESLMKRISNSSFGYEYKPDSFIKAQKKWYQRNYGVELNNKHLIYSPSVTTTIAVLIENFTAENEGIIIQPPVFMEFRDVIRNKNVRL